MKKKVSYLYDSLAGRIKNEYLIYLLAFGFILVADLIGQIRIPVGKGAFIIFPIFFAIIMGILSGPQVFKILGEPRVKAASKLVIVAILPFIAKLGINAGAQIMVVLKAGPALLLQELGNLGTIFLALPVALLLGLKRESIGATHSINRETNLALVQDMFGPDSPEARGSLSVYIVGGMIGTIYFGFMASMIASTGWFHPYSLGMASGVGAGIMMASATASLAEVLPAFAEEMSALASTSETLSGITGIYVAIFIGIPLCNWLYKHLEPKLGRVTKAGRRAAEELQAGLAARAEAAHLTPAAEEEAEAAQKKNADKAVVGAVRYTEWLFLLAVAGLGIILANFVGFGVSPLQSLPGVLLLLGIAFVAVLLDNVLPIRLPVIAYCSIIGLLLAIPASPVSGWVIEAAGQINFTAPLTMVGAFAGMSISSQLKTFAKQGWKMIIIALLVMTGTFIGSLVISQLVLGITGAI